ncbi:hypothetical protein [Citricoccus sp. I39-566]|uniref:hypothetical protein n=1 Tax=Citricoccus sp. I39-566 TaxID=3073268 RepID=UPI00286D3EDA|nr:hypothetical protein [Citricoccus sp. I39-566]WMY79130.1 hypothetical protein RE421_04490 [Citricoccus sp. I39-566]
MCRETDPAWTPLFTIAAAVVTETGGCCPTRPSSPARWGSPPCSPYPGLPRL